MSKPTPAQEAEALALWEAGDLEGIVAVIQERDSFRYASDKQAVAWKARAESAEGRLCLLKMSIETHLSATKESK